MNTTPKTKLCWNCEARVSPYEENCPYCCVYLNPLPKPKEEEQMSPPYDLENEEQEQKIPASPYATAEEPIMTQQEYEEPTASTTIQERGILLPMGLLIAGSVMLLFSLALFLFSVDGQLTLSWNGNYWYIYLFIALPMIFLGWRTLRFLDDEPA